jgi:formylglycine-generating enzyme required for sulfatase activity
VPAQFRGWSSPQHRVAIAQRFALGVYEVTRGEYAAFVAEARHAAGDTCWQYTANGMTNSVDGGERAGSWNKLGFAQTDRHPALCVSWRDAKAYAQWLARKTGKPYRLPTEAEWEYGARAGTLQVRFWGNARKDACRFANVADFTLYKRDDLTLDRHNHFACADGFARTAPVGSFKPNGFGLFDMLGNVSEWVEDCWREGYRGARGNGAPDVSGDCSFRVVRGGSWHMRPWDVRSGSRVAYAVDVRDDGIGFRVALSLDAPQS